MSRYDDPRPLLLALVTACCAGSAANALAARTIAVPQEAPSIALAAASADSGDVVLVSCGRYRETNIHIPNGVNVWSGTLQPGCVTVDGNGAGRIFVFTDCDSSTSLFGFTITGGVAPDDDPSGGAIYLRAASPRIANCVIANNTADNGGGIYCGTGSTPRISSCTFRDNEAAEQGGGLYWGSSGTGVVAECEFTDNRALTGGAVFVTDGTKTEFSQCQFNHNSAANSGGALAVAGAGPRLVYCVLANNWGGLGGGGIGCTAATPSLSHCTLYANRAEYSGGAIAYLRSVLRLDHCIIAFHAPNVIDGEPRFRPELTRCNLFGNAGGDWTGSIADQADQRDNFSRDPLFCAPNYGDLYLEAGSWCLPENRPDGTGGLVGALGPGCAVTHPAADGESTNRRRPVPPGPE